MKNILVCFLIASTAIFAATKKENLKSIVTKSYLGPNTDAMYDMIAMQAIAQTGKKLEPTKLVSAFRKEFVKQENLEKFYAAYDEVFSEEEVVQLKAIFESPVWEKYSKDGLMIAQSHIQIIQSIFQELAEKAEADIRELSTEILEITKDNMSALTESEKPVILDIHADWCAPCQAMEPIFEDLSEKYKDSLQFAKMNFDEQKELANKYKVSSLPTILFIKPGESEASKTNVGFLAKEDFEKKIDEFLETLK